MKDGGPVRDRAPPRAAPARTGERARAALAIAPALPAIRPWVARGSPLARGTPVRQGRRAPGSANQSRASSDTIGKGLSQRIDYREDENRSPVPAKTASAASPEMPPGTPDALRAHQAKPHPEDTARLKPRCQTLRARCALRCTIRFITRKHLCALKRAYFGVPRLRSAKRDHAEIIETAE